MDQALDGGDPPPPQYYSLDSLPQRATNFQTCFPETVVHDSQQILVQQPTSTNGAMMSQSAGDGTRSKPRDYLWFSILNFLFCWPLAIIALNFSLKARKCSARNDMTAAKEHGDGALGVNIAALVNGSILQVLIFLFHNGYLSRQ
ncbi:uncharacterized protein LOC120916249 isoform X2 [Rana temporaria]|uniref:uncharacterized protein LOC120916249 isoform X2 n=1 Tax=Rana temporaria TaxID=8407 RepID=UPI001AADAD35|nr:uncharacterized protein LOC120916249 isoform X2 [Rana temporaria]